jgi:GNAT superfamily N-acetyltransferase
VEGQIVSSMKSNMHAASALMTNGERIVLRPPRGIELRACRMFLPEPLPRRLPTGFLVAVGEQSFQILGAASHAADVYEGQRALRVALRVIQPCRRQGVGSQLVNALVSIARGGRYRTIVTCHHSDQGSAGEPFVRAMGFLPRERITVFEFDPRHSRFLESLRNRMVGVGKIPPTARIVSLDEAPLEQVVQLQVASMGGTTEGVRCMLEEGIKRGSMLPASVVLMIENEVQGVLLVELVESSAVVESIIVASSYRGGWANVFLKEAALQRVFACGVREVSFASLTTNRDTLKFATRCSARVAEVKSFYTLDLNNSFHD